MAKALVIGASGQDGSYLCELLIEKGYDVHALVRRSSNEPRNHSHLINQIAIHYGDLCHDRHLDHLIYELKPEMVFNLAAQSDVKISFEDPEYTGDVDALGCLRVLEAIRYFSPRSRYYFAATSELFGNSAPPQNESTPMDPQSPYGVAKLYGCAITRVYRKSYGLFACNGILFNHESERRGTNFVTRKITKAVADIVYHNQEKLELGNLDAKRDWGYAPDYVEAMYLMLQQSKPDDYVVGTGEAHTVREFVQEAFSYVGLDYQDYVVINPEYYRPCEVNYLCADASKAKKILGWQPKVTFKELVRRMVAHDLKEAGQVVAVK